MFADLGTTPKHVYEQNGGFYYKEYEQHPGEEGWYVYFKPSDPRCRAIRERGPMKGGDADDLIEQLTRERFGA